MTKLRERAMNEKDKQSASKEIKLLRQLLREDDSSKREALLTEAFTPKEALIVSSHVFSFGLVIGTLSLKLSLGIRRSPMLGPWDHGERRKGHGRRGRRG